MHLTQSLAERILAISYDRLPAAAIAWTRNAVIDTIGVTLAGAAEETTRILLETPGIAEAPGPALVFGTQRRTSSLDATLVNGTAGHALDYDDVSEVMGGHPSVMLVPMLIALGEARGAGGRDLVLAYVAGFETEIRLARGVNFHHYDKGWHPTATLGTIGAAAAAARMMNLDPGRTATALAVAASLASGIKANFGSMTKPLHIGQGARNGLFAALVAERGFSANAGALDGRQGFLDVFNGPGSYDVGKILAGWGEPFEVEAATNGLKQYACCGSTHASIGAILALRREHGLRPDDVERIEILAHRRRLPHTDNPDPHTALAGKFSIQYIVARALVDGAVRLDHFAGEAHRDPAIRRLLALTQARPHPGMPDDSPRQFGAEVVVTTKSGRRLSHLVENDAGRGPENPMSGEELFEKFADCAERVLPRGQVAPLFDRLENLETVSDLQALTRLIEPQRAPSPPRGAAPEGSAALAAESSWIP